MISHSPYNEGTDLALELIKFYNETKKEVTLEEIERIKKIFASYEEKESSESLEVSFEIKLTKENFMKTAVKWASRNVEMGKQLEDLLAIHFFKYKEYNKAQRYFVRGNPQIELLSKMLLEWSHDEEEPDLFLARAVLLYLSLSNLRDANELFSRNQNFFPQTPLVHFLGFLLPTLERDALPLFNFLRNKYKPSIERDPSFQKYLDQISFIFYNVEASNSGNLFGNLLKTFFSSDSTKNK